MISSVQRNSFGSKDRILQTMLERQAERKAREAAREFERSFKHIEPRPLEPSDFNPLPEKLILEERPVRLNKDLSEYSKPLPNKHIDKEPFEPIRPKKLFNDEARPTLERKKIDPRVQRAFDLMSGNPEMTYADALDHIDAVDAIKGASKVKANPNELWTNNAKPSIPERKVIEPRVAKAFALMSIHPEMTLADALERADAMIAIKPPSENNVLKGWTSNAKPVDKRLDFDA